MNKLVRAAVVGGAALAVGVLPAAGLAGAATAPTPPAPVSPTTAPTVTPTTTPTTSPTHAPVHHKKPKTKHHKVTKRKHKKGSPAGGGGVTKHKPVRHRPTHQPVPPTTTTMPAPRIVGGKAAPDVPWAVQVSWDSTGFECTGTAIAAQWVLTAGHCADQGDMTVLIGSNQLGQGTKATVDQKVVDPDGDMALLHLTEPAATTFVKLADTDPKVGAIDQIYGFGKTDQDSGPSPDLKVAKVKVTSVGDDCQDGMQGQAICSKAINGYAFNGDSGGPEIDKGVEVGVCSTGEADTKTQEYASVAANRAWIQQVANV